MSGKDQKSFDEIERALQERMKELPHAKGVYFDNDRLQESWYFVPNVEKMESYNLTPNDLSNQMAGVFSPVPLGFTRFNSKQVRIYSEVQGGDKLDFDKLNDLKIQTPQLTLIPVSYLGSWEKSSSQSFIRHRDGKRVLRTRH